MVSAISWKSCLVMPSTNTMGRKTQIVVRVEEVIAPATCDAPETAAFTGESPRLLKR